MKVEVAPCNRHFCRVIMILLWFMATALATVKSQDHSVCGRLGRAYESICPSQMTGASIPLLGQVPAGKRGPAGPKGDRGPPGLQANAAEANYSRVNEMITLQLDDAIEAQRRNITDLSSALLEANEKIRDLLNKTVDYCPIQYDGKCFWVEVRRMNAITFEQAKAICKAKGATPANIYSDEHHYMMMGYVRPFGSRDGQMYVWVGMTYSFETTTTYHYDGVTEASFTLWYPNNPHRSRCCNIMLYTRMDWNDKNQHLYAYSPTSGVRGVLCEKVFH